MKKLPLDPADHELIAAAHREFDKPTRHDWHGVSAAIRLKSGSVVTGLVLEAEVPALTVRAEPITIGKALADIAADPVVCVVATREREGSDHKVIPPCGRCREFITDYCPEATVIVFDETDACLYKIPASDLLPFKYVAVP